MKKVSFASSEVSLIRRALEYMARHSAIEGRQDVKSSARILEKLTKAEQPNDPAVNAPLLEDTLLTYSGGKLAPLALPNWQRYARQGAQVGATVADAQTIGQWMNRQDWIARGSMTLQSVLNNWSSWLGKARAAQEGLQRPQAGLNGQAGHVGPGPGPQRQVPQGRRPAPGFGRKVP